MIWNLLDGQEGCSFLSGRSFWFASCISNDLQSQLAPNLKQQNAPVAPLNFLLCFQTQPIPIPLAPLSTLVPRLRCSVEGLNQELEAMLICQPTHTQHRVTGTSAPTTKFTKRNHLFQLSCTSNKLVLSFFSAPRCSRWPPSSRPTADHQQQQQQSISEWHYHYNTLLLFFLAKSPAIRHVCHPTHLCKCFTWHATRSVFKFCGSHYSFL